MPADFRAQVITPLHIRMPITIVPRLGLLSSAIYDLIQVKLTEISDILLLSEMNTDLLALLADMTDTRNCA